MTIDSTNWCNDIAFSSIASNFPGMEKLADSIIHRIKSIYREKALICIHLFDRSVLWQQWKVLTSQMIDDIIVNARNK